MKFPTATRKDHEKFCTVEGWGTHHVNYELELPDGRILLTRVSHPADRTDYGAQLWAHILRDQLAVTSQEFWGCVNRQIKPDRGTSGEPPTDALPIGVVTTLIELFHIPESQVRSMSKEQAIARMVECYAEQHPKP